MKLQYSMSVLVAAVTGLAVGLAITQLASRVLQPHPHYTPGDDIAAIVLPLDSLVRMDAELSFPSVNGPDRKLSIPPEQWETFVAAFLPVEPREDDGVLMEHLARVEMKYQSGKKLRVEVLASGERVVVMISDSWSSSSYLSGHLRTYQVVLGAMLASIHAQAQ